MEDQTLYCELINQRKKKLLALDKASDKAFLDEQRRRDAISYQKEQTMLQRQTAIDISYRNQNFADAETRYQHRHDRSSKSAELLQAMQELQKYEEEKLEQMKRDLV